VILGILSDTHGRRQRTAEALRILRAAGAEAVVHCGDMGDEGLIEEFAGWRAWLVRGNCDRAHPAVSALAGSLGLTLAHQVPLLIRLDGRVLAVFHGHEPQFARVERFLETGNPPSLGGELRDCDYILHGHTHQRRDEQVGRVRIINPGALHRASVYTVATLDLRTDRVEFRPVPESALAESRPLKGAPRPAGPDVEC
jgi:hypothetical protein